MVVRHFSLVENGMRLLREPIFICSASLFDLMECADVVANLVSIPFRTFFILRNSLALSLSTLLTLSSLILSVHKIRSEQDDGSFSLMFSIWICVYRCGVVVILIK